MPKISALAEVASPTGNETVVVVDGTNTRKARFSGLVAGAVGSAGIWPLAASANGNAITVSTPSGGFQDGRLYRFTSPTTTTGAVTINDRPLLGSDGNPVLAGALANGGEVVLRFRIAGVVFILVSAATRRVDALET